MQSYSNSSRQLFISNRDHEHYRQKLHGGFLPTPEIDHAVPPWNQVRPNDPHDRGPLRKARTNARQTASQLNPDLHRVPIRIALEGARPQGTPIEVPPLARVLPPMFIPAPQVQPRYIASPPWAAGAQRQPAAQAQNNYVLPPSDNR